MKSEKANDLFHKHTFVVYTSEIVWAMEMAVIFFQVNSGTLT